MAVKMLLLASALATGFAVAGAVSIHDGPVLAVVIVVMVVACLAGGMAYAWPLSWRDYVHGSKTMLPVAAISALVALPPFDLSFFGTLFLLLFAGFLFSRVVGKLQLSKETGDEDQTSR